MSWHVFLFYPCPLSQPKLPALHPASSPPASTGRRSTLKNPRFNTILRQNCAENKASVAQLVVPAGSASAAGRQGPKAADLYLIFRPGRGARRMTARDQQVGGSKHRFTAAPAQPVPPLAQSGGANMKNIPTQSGVKFPPGASYSTGTPPALKLQVKRIRHTTIGLLP